MTEFLQTIPGKVSALALTDSVRTSLCGGLAMQSSQTNRMSVAKAVQSGASRSFPPGAILELDDRTSVTVEAMLGMGKQGAVYSLRGNNHVCLKIGLNALSAKQFRRELIAANEFTRLGVRFPKLLAYDEFGLWILKERWNVAQFCGTELLRLTERRLPENNIRQLKQCAEAFSNVGLCADFTPSNVIFASDGCCFYETTAWSSSSHRGWTFKSCFLPMWLPNGTPEADLVGFPPYAISADYFDSPENDLNSEENLRHWRLAFPRTPLPHPAWWRVSEL